MNKDYNIEEMHGEGLKQAKELVDKEDKTESE